MHLNKCSPKVCDGQERNSMDADLIRTLGLAAAGIMALSAGAALLIIKIMLSPALGREIDEELHRRNL
jgi:hypothetical protein